MSSKTTTMTSQVILFSLDGLYDHSHSLQHAMADVQEAYKELAAFTIDSLVQSYTNATQCAQYAYAMKQTPPYKDQDNHKVQIFYTGLGLPRPSTKKCEEFRGVYANSFHTTQRATLGAIDTMTQLREMGHSVSVVVRGTAEYELVRLEKLGIRHLVDFLLTEDEASMVGPTIRIFGGSNVTSMDLARVWNGEVRPSIKADITQALADGDTAVLYKPDTTERHMKVWGREVPIISEMSQLPKLVETVCAAQAISSCVSS